MPDLRWLTSVFTPEAHWGLANTFRAKDDIVYLPPMEETLSVSLSLTCTHTHARTILTAVDSAFHSIPGAFRKIFFLFTPMD